MSGILKLESLTKGNTLKQGDKTPLKYRLFDADGEKLNIAGKSAKVRLVYPDFLTIGYEKEGLTVAQDDTVTFTIDSVIPPRMYHVEIIVDGKFIFPSREDEAKFTIDKSSLGTETSIIEIVGVDAVVRKAVDLINDDPSLIIDEGKLVTDIISNTGIGNINEYYKAFNDLKPKAEQSITKSDESLTKSQIALSVANGIDAKATNALNLSESADTLSKSVQNNFNQIVTGITDKDIVSAPEIMVARGGFDTLDERLNDTDLHLDHLQSIENANSSNILDFNNYLGNAQNIHPKVISFTQPWNGYKYWMAFTPYPKGDTDAENPSVRASNNLVDWVLPSGMIDPIDPTPPVGYNSDTHMVYRPDLDRLEVWWRQVRNETNDIAIIREISTDGINWINKQTMHQAQNTSEDMLSPSIIFEDGLYKVWYCARGSQVVKYAEMNPDATWNFTSQHVPIEWGDLSPWHLDVIHTDLGYEMVINAYNKTIENSSTLDLYYVIVDDNNMASKPRKIIARSNDPNAIDFKSIYRSSILKEGGKYYIFYSSIDRENNRWMSLSFGESPFGLTGLKGQKFKEAKELRISAGSNLVDLDVSGIDNLVINGGAEVTLNSLMGGYLGKKITIYLYALNATVYLQSSDRIRLPSGNSFVMEYTYHPTMELMCTSTDGREWRVLDNIAKTSSATVNVSASGNPTLTDYDISGISVLRITGAGTLTIESFKPTHTGQILYVVLASSAKVKFVDSSGKIRTPGLVDYELDISKMGVTVVCTNASIGECRVIG